MEHKIEEDSPQRSPPTLETQFRYRRLNSARRSGFPSDHQFYFMLLTPTNADSEHARNQCHMTNHL